MQPDPQSARSSSPRMVVAFQRVESTRQRQFRQAFSGNFDGLTPQPILRRGDFLGSGRGEGYYWCAADAPETDDDFALRPIHRTSKVDELARCEECGIAIGELQQDMTRLLRSRR